MKNWFADNDIEDKLPDASKLKRGKRQRSKASESSTDRSNQSCNILSLAVTFIPLPVSCKENWMRDNSSDFCISDSLCKHRMDWFSDRSWYTFCIKEKW